MTLRSHAETELALIGMGPDADEINRMMREHILKMVDTFADEGHSGFSAAYAIGIIEKLLRFEPVTPLTGEDDEWSTPFDPEETRQNKRCGHVFLRSDGVAYDSEARVFYDEYVDDEGNSQKSHYTCRESRKKITFPYTPTREYLPTNAREQYSQEFSSK
jgi:hypothetical protein